MAALCPFMALVYGFKGGGATTTKLDAVFADDLTPDKARVLTMLALPHTRIQPLFRPTSINRTPDTEPDRVWWPLLPVSANGRTQARQRIRAIGRRADNIRGSLWGEPPADIGLQVSGVSASGNGRSLAAIRFSSRRMCCLLAWA